MFGRYREDVVDAKAMEFSNFRCLFLRINFVDDDIDRFAGSAQEPDEFLIRRCDAASAIRYKEDECRRPNCDLRLFEDANRDLGLLARNEAAGIDDFIP